MRRREFIGLIGGAAAWWPLVAKAQPKLPIIGVLGIGQLSYFGELRDGLAEGGFVEGRDYTFEYRSALSAQYQHDQIAAQSADLLQRSTTANEVIRVFCHMCISSQHLIGVSDNLPLN